MKLALHFVTGYRQWVKAIALAKLKNERVGAATLTHRLRTNLLLDAWAADQAVRRLRQVTR